MYHPHLMYQKSSIKPTGNLNESRERHKGLQLQITNKLAHIERDVGDRFASFYYFNNTSPQKGKHKCGGGWITLKTYS